MLQTTEGGEPAWLKSLQGGNNNFFPARLVEKSQPNSRCRERKIATGASSVHAYFKRTIITLEIVTIGDVQKIAARFKI